MGLSIARFVLFDVQYIRVKAAFNQHFYSAIGKLEQLHNARHSTHGVEVGIVRLILGSFSLSHSAIRAYQLPSQLQAPESTFHALQTEG